MAIEKIKELVKLLPQIFHSAVENIHVLPIFQEAAEGEDDGGGVKYHGMAPIGLPGAKFHAMTGQAENTNLVRQSRAAAKGYRAQVLDRPDYYDSFDGVNSLKM